MKLQDRSPRDLMFRCLVLDEIKALDVDKVREYNENLVSVYDEIDEDSGDEIEIVEVDWEYCVFDAPIYEMQKVLEAVWFEGLTPEQKAEILEKAKEDKVQADAALEEKAQSIIMPTEETKPVEIINETK